MTSAASALTCYVGAILAGATDLAKAAYYPNQSATVSGDQNTRRPKNGEPERKPVRRNRTPKANPARNDSRLTEPAGSFLQGPESTIPGLIDALRTENPEIRLRVHETLKA